MSKVLNKFSISITLMAVVLFQLQGCGGSEQSAQAMPNVASPFIGDTSSVLFDDFNYNDLPSLQQNGWKVRTQTGHPGVAGAAWSADGISLHKEAEGSDNQILRMTSYTDGTGEGTQHTQFCHARKYYEGTYAARVYFRDEPDSGPDGDVIIETFYAISPLKAPMDLDYSETDFEYLANGGWGEGPNPKLWSTTWETFQLEPWTKDNKFSFIEGSYAGWRTLVLQIAEQKVSYFVDGQLFAEHDSHVYPEQPMSINFNLWFTPEGLIDSSERRTYSEDVDWVFYAADTLLDTEEVEQAVIGFRERGIPFQDTVPAWTPELESPCGL